LIRKPCSKRFDNSYDEASRISMIRTLLAEDSPTARVLMTEILQGDGDLKVVAIAKDGSEAVAMTKQLQPDVIVMDLHMPEMNGLEATTQIMVEAPTPIIIVTATGDARAVAVSMHALRAGALTVLPKPTGPAGGDFEQTARQFRETVKAMSQVKVVRRWATTRPSDRPRRAVAGEASAIPASIVAIGASTGGPAALYRIFSELPGNFPVPILVVQHIAHGFVAGFVDWLNAGSPLDIRVARHGDAIAPRTVYLARDDQHLGLLDRHTLAVSSAPPVGGFRPSASFLFESVARLYGRAATAVVLTGMGQDGLEGLRAVRASGGRIIAQDEQSSIVFGMPGAAVGAGLADLTLPLSAIAFRLGQLVSEKSTA
jgi:two-component system, chemotaxis family, protein-glutamate methylesterase/glutaminase